MTPSDDQELLTLFAAEAAEHLDTLNKTLLQLEAVPREAPHSERRRYLDVLSRAAHSLKGASRVVGLTSIERIAHRMESIFDAVQADRLSMSPDVADMLYSALDRIEAALAGHVDEDADTDSWLDALDDLAAPEATPNPAHHLMTVSGFERPNALTYEGASALTTQTVPGAEESIRVTIARLDDLMADATDLLIARSRIEQRLAELHVLRRLHQHWQKAWRRARTHYLRAVRQSEQPEDWGELLGFLNITQQYLRQTAQQLLALERSLTADSLHLNMLTGSLQDRVRSLRLVPFETQINFMQRVVRDVARTEGKEVTLQVIGASIALDKRVLEAIKDPIIHLLRNAVDHGIEAPTEREQAGKPRQGIVIIALSQRGGQVTINIADDGRGIDPEAVRRAAQRLLNPAEIDTLSDAEVIALVTRPGLSTSSRVTAISGRGLGLDIVRENVEALQGRIAIESSPGNGATFQLVIPVSLSTIRCMLARIGAETYAIPTTSIEHIISLESTEADDRYSAAGHPMLKVDGRPVGLIPLADVLERPPGGPNRYVIVLASGDRRMAFLVDDVLAEQEVVVKNLNPELAQVRHVIGATILGSGEVVIILNVSDLIKTAHGRFGHQPAAAQSSKSRPVRKATILVVDDSVTTRTLEKNILEAAGYNVATATNGVEALDMLSRTPCALVVADVQMPYMDGFELTSRLRHSERYNQLPVVLVTSLDTAEFKERGFQAGANAYIVKGKFDQGELLQAIAQLIGQTEGGT